MPDFYVYDADNDGVADSWPQAIGTVYASIMDAVSIGNAGAGDRVLCSDIHNGTDSGSNSYYTGLTLISVDHSDPSRKSAGAVNRADVGNNALKFENTYAYGIVFGDSIRQCGDVMLLQSSYVEKCTIDIQAGRHIDTGSLFNSKFVDCVISTDDSTLFSFGYSALLECIHCSITLQGGASPLLLNGAWSQERSTVRFVGGSIECLTGTLTLANWFASNPDNSSQVIFEGTKLPPTYIVQTGLADNCEGSVQIYGTTHPESFYVEKGHGIYEDDTAVYRLAQRRDQTNYSQKVATTSYAKNRQPLTFLLANEIIDTSQFSGTITAKIHAIEDGVSGVPDTDDICFSLEYVDGSDSGRRFHVRSVKGSLLNDDAFDSNWTDSSLGTEGVNFKRFSEEFQVTIGSAPGNIQSGAIRIFVDIFKPDAVFYFDRAVTFT